MTKWCGNTCRNRNENSIGIVDCVVYPCLSLRDNKEGLLLEDAGINETQEKWTCLFWGFETVLCNMNFVQINNWVNECGGSAHCCCTEQPPPDDLWRPDGNSIVGGHTNRHVEGGYVIAVLSVPSWFVNEEFLSCSWAWNWISKKK